MSSVAELVIDGEDFHSVDDLHLYIKQKLDFPDYYGMNPDALWDCLTDFLYGHNSLTVHWSNFKKSQDTLGQEAEFVRTVFLQAQKQFPKSMKLTIQE